MLGIVADHRAGAELFGPYAARWVTSRIVRGRSLTPATIQGYQALLRRNLLPHLEDTPLRQIRPETVRTWHATITTDNGADQAAKSYRLLRAILNTAVDDEVLVANPCRIRGGGAENAAERPMIPTEMVLDLADAIGPRYRALVLLSGIGALRTGELLGLRRRDVDLLHRRLSVVQQAQEVTGPGRIVVRPKSDAGRREVMLPGLLVEPLEEHLAAYAELGPDGVVFTGPEGTRCAGPPSQPHGGQLARWSVRPSGYTSTTAGTMRLRALLRSRASRSRNSWPPSAIRRRGRR